MLPKNAEHACCIVSFFHFHEARAVLQYNGVKTNISPRVLHHAENIVNNPLLLRWKNRHLRFKGCSTVCQARRYVGFASQPSGTEAEKNGYRSEMSPGGGPACARCQEASRGSDTFQLDVKRGTLTWNAILISVFPERRIYTAHLSNHNIITVTL